MPAPGCIKNKSIFAITFQLPEHQLQAHYPTLSHQDAIRNLDEYLQGHGFTRQQDFLYFGNPDIVNEVACILAVFDLVQKYPWFAVVAQDVRMLRIAADTDLAPIINKAAHSISTNILPATNGILLSRNA